MSRFLASTFLLTAMPITAAAADLPLRPTPVVYGSPYSWTGFYLGVNAGYGLIDRSADPVCVDPFGVANGPGCLLPPSVKPRAAGFIAGGQAGYNYQFTPGSGVVVGIETDLQFTRLRGFDTEFGTFPLAGGGAFPFSTFKAGQSLD